MEDENMTSAKMTRILKRLRIHGIIKKVNNTKKYYITEIGKKVVSSIAKIKENILMPTLSGYACTK